VRGILKALPQYLPDSRPRTSTGCPSGAACARARPTACRTSAARGASRTSTVGAGHSMMGVSLAPVTGSLIAEILSGERRRSDRRPSAAGAKKVDIDSAPGDHGRRGSARSRREGSTLGRQ
jgi:glycine/D-amino acid oxidase-like deaminating enzyme